MSHCREVLPFCEQIMCLGIGFPELLAFHGAIMKKTDLDNMPMETAAYRVMEDIENYNKLGGMKKQLFDTSIQINMVEQILAPKQSDKRRL